MMDKQKLKTKRKPDDFDCYAGRRLRLRRIVVGLSQEKLASEVDLTFQQIQKYEKGKNRMAAGMLYKFSRILDVPFGYFAMGFGEAEPKTDDFLTDKTMLLIFKKYKLIQEINPEFSKVMQKFLNMFLK